MPWQKKNKIKPVKLGESIILKLRNQKRSNEELEIMISGLSLEELIWLKLELSAKIFANNKFYGFPLYHSFPKIAKDALVNFAVFATSSKREAARFLGINQAYLEEILKKFKVRHE